MYSSGLFYKFVRCPVAYILVSRSQVFIQRCVMVFTHLSCMAGNTLVVEVDLNACGGIEYLHLLANVAVGNTVVMFVYTKTGMPVLHDRNDDLLFKLITVNRKHLQGRSFYFFKLLPAAVIPAFKGSVVKHFKCLPYSCIKLFQRGIWQWCVDSSIDTLINDLYHSFHQCLVLGAVSSCRQYNGCIMLCKVCKSLVNNRFIFAAFDYGGLQVIGYNSCRNTAEVMKSILARLDQVFFFLAVYNFYICKLTATQYGNKHFHIY